MIGLPRHALLTIALVAGIPVAVETGAVEGRTLDRFHDPVVVSTGLLAGLPDRRTAPYPSAPTPSPRAPTSRWSSR